ncbi:hypothetical protein [Streptomyces yunnanensis]|uniref:Uncharacterized protein n=1 Tax=Streptomyces yunnanensis TaxID=156453 RepID=A0A9X8N6P9_9ACTN|nr:hypothetical protein [Streptomyces yunnanensis]SHN17184.1 hypothetical protein SAMN05216268_12271 [Streptomyces yunnanensis]
MELSAALRYATDPRRAAEGAAALGRAGRIPALGRRRPSPAAWARRGSTSPTTSPPPTAAGASPRTKAEGTIAVCREAGVTGLNVRPIGPNPAALGETVTSRL